MTLLYCIMVTGPVYGNQRAVSALQFIQALLQYGHKINTVFFYQDGIYNANRFSSPASDEIDLVNCWCFLAQKYKFELHVCHSAALRRGVIDSHASLEGSHRSESNLKQNFQLSGLSNLAYAMLHCNRFIQF